MPVQSSTPTTAALLRLIASEYREMPGLSLTEAQARRFWGLDADTCTTLLQELVDQRFLLRTPDGRYVRLTEWTVRARPLRAGEVTPRPRGRKPAAGE